jgi:hypothetical protein
MEHHMDILFLVIAVVCIAALGLSASKKRSTTNTPSTPAAGSPPVDTAPWIDTTNSDNSGNNTGNEVLTPPKM